MSWASNHVGHGLDPFHPSLDGWAGSNSNPKNSLLGWTRFDLTQFIFNNNIIIIKKSKKNPKHFKGHFKIL